MAIKARDAFRTISEVADWLDVPAHVLRFWESKFSQIKPVKRAGGRRYYRPDDMLLIGGIKKLLHDDGMTIRGVQKMLKEEGVKTVAALSQSLDGVDEAASPRTKRRKSEVEAEAKDAPIETGPEKEVVEEAETIAAWAADAEAESAPAEDSRGPIHIDPTAAAPAAEDAPAAEAHSSIEPEPEPKPEPESAEAEDAADNVVAMPTRSEPEAETEPETETEPEQAPQTAFDLETAPDAEKEAPPAEPEPAAAQPEGEQEQTPPAIEMPAEAAEATPEPAATGPSDAQIAATGPSDAQIAATGPSDAQIAARALKRSLRGSDSHTLVADPALAAQAARLTALRDRIAAQVAGD